MPCGLASCPNHGIRLKSHIGRCVGAAFHCPMPDRNSSTLTNCIRPSGALRAVHLFTNAFQIVIPSRLLHPGGFFCLDDNFGAAAGILE